MNKYWKEKLEDIVMGFAILLGVFVLAVIIGMIKFAFDSLTG